MLQPDLLQIKKKNETKEPLWLSSLHDVRIQSNLISSLFAICHHNFPLLFILSPFFGGSLNCYKIWFTIDVMFVVVVVVAGSIFSIANELSFKFWSIHTHMLQWMKIAFVFVIFFWMFIKIIKLGMHCLSIFYTNKYNWRCLYRIHWGASKSVNLIHVTNFIHTFHQDLGSNNCLDVK